MPIFRGKDYEVIHFKLIRECNHVKFEDVMNEFLNGITEIVDIEYYYEYVNEDLEVYAAKVLYV